MKQITVENYRSDKYYPGLVRAVNSILGREDCVSPIEVFIEMELLSVKSVAEALGVSFGSSGEWVASPQNSRGR